MQHGDGHDDNTSFYRRFLSFRLLIENGIKVKKVVPSQWSKSHEMELHPVSAYNIYHTICKNRFLKGHVRSFFKVVWLTYLHWVYSNIPSICADGSLQCSNIQTGSAPLIRSPFSLDKLRLKEKAFLLKNGRRFFEVGGLTSQKIAFIIASLTATVHCSNRLAHYSIL